MSCDSLFGKWNFTDDNRMRGGATKTRKAAKAAKKNSPPRSTMGRLLPPIDIKEDSQLRELEKRIKEGPLTLVLVYADWCGHCQKFKPTMEQLENIPERSIQTARIRDDMFPKSPISSAKIEGYPTLMLVDKSGNVESFKTEDGQVTNAIPDHTNVQKMTALVRTAGRKEGLNALEESKEPATISVQPPSISNLSNATVNPSIATPEIPKNILADRLSESSVQKLNANLVRSSNSLLKEATAPMKGGAQTGGSLWSQLMVASGRLAPAAALFMGAEAYRQKRKSRRSRRRSSKSKRRAMTRRR
jgi:thiol-disulfide isomerase/thioredoxin